MKDMPVANTIVSLITAVGGVVVSFALLLPIFRKTKQLEQKTDEVHVMVNQQRTDAERYQGQLVKALEAHGINVPKDESKE